MTAQSKLALITVAVCLSGPMLHAQEVEMTPADQAKLDVYNAIQAAGGLDCDDCSMPFVLIQHDTPSTEKTRYDAGLAKAHSRT